uniref:Small ribosomal subunit protein bS6 n=1 Tax=Candidatus Caldatribacterium californiense TaxID=1454726 RepID=A0A7V3YNE8_9BACT
MQEYELGVVIRPTLAEDSVQSIVEKLKNTILDQGGVVNAVDFWGKRKLAYPIEKQREGYYVFLRFAISPKNVAEVSRVARYTEDILRHILVKEEKARSEEKPQMPKETEAQALTGGKETNVPTQSE